MLNIDHSKNLIRLNEALRRVAPLVQIVSIPDEFDSAEYFLAESATPEHHEAAARVYAEFDWSKSAIVEWEKQKKPAREELRKHARGAVLRLREFLNSEKTPDEVLRVVETMAENQIRIINRLIQWD